MRWYHWAFGAVVAGFVLAFQQDWLEWRDVWNVVIAVLAVIGFVLVVRHLGRAGHDRNVDDEMYRQDVRAEARRRRGR